MRTAPCTATRMSGCNNGASLGLFVSFGSDGKVIGFVSQD